MPPTAVTTLARHRAGREEVTRRRQLVLIESMLREGRPEAEIVAALDGDAGAEPERHDPSRPVPDRYRPTGFPAAERGRFRAWRTPRR
jgi:hypothetical protein